MLIEKVQKFIKMLPEFKGTKYEETLKRVDLHASVRVDLPFRYELPRMGMS